MGGGPGGRVGPAPEGGVTVGRERGGGGAGGGEGRGRGRGREGELPAGLHLLLEADFGAPAGRIPEEATVLYFTPSFPRAPPRRSQPPPVSARLGQVPVPVRPGPTLPS